jgi:signal transduction histidine kinase/ligand-binding sensor domain-containing protein
LKNERSLRLFLLCFVRTRTWFAGLFFLSVSVHALDPGKRLTQYMHMSWKMQDGSAPSGMWSIAQTSDGFLWLTSSAGDLFRFDGVHFVPWDFPSERRPSRQMTDVLGDHSGGLWVVRLRDVVYQKGNVVVSRPELAGASDFQGMSEDPDGSLWVALYSSPRGLSFCHIKEQVLKCFGKADGVPLSSIDAVLADGKGGVWLGGSTALVHWHNGVTETYPIPALKSNVGQSGIGSLALGPDGTVWIGILAEGPGLGLGRLVQGAVKPFVEPALDGSKVEVNGMIFDRDGNLWVATVGKGVFRIRGNVVDHYGYTDGLSGDTVRGVFEDREGIVWAVTTNGIDSFRDPRIVTFSASEGLSKDSAEGVLVRRDDTIWIAGDGSLDSIEKNGTIHSIRAGNGLPGHQVTCMLEDRAGNLWVGVDDDLYVYKDHRFLRLTETNHQPLGLVLGLVEDTDGNIWAECKTDSRKLVRIRDFKVSRIFNASQIPPGHTLAPDPKGGIWIGTVDGDIALIRHGVVSTRFPVVRVGDRVIRQITTQDDGSVLAGSEEGLVVWRQGKLLRLTTKNGLPCNQAISFIRDKEKNWWLDTDCGVVELPDSEFQRWWAHPDTVVRIRVDDASDGFRPGEPFFNASALSADGRVWFANGAVLQMIDPSKLRRFAPPAAMAQIESVIVDRKVFQTTESLKLLPHSRDIQIDYTSPTFLVPQKVRFRYRLEGYDQEWHDAGARRQAFYMDLPPAKYAFRVIACNSDGTWNDHAAEFDFSIVPAYYQTTWFRIACATLFLALAWAIYLLRVRHLHQQFELSLEARVSERIRIARDLHDTLLQGAHGLLLHLGTVSQLLRERSEETQEALDQAIKQTAEFIIQARDEVQGLRDSTVESNDLALAITMLGQELASDSVHHHRAPAFHVSVEGEVQNLQPIVRDEIYKISAEALRNAFRHSEARRIEVELRYDHEHLRLRVRDDGKGINAKILSGEGSEGHHGLRGISERAALIGAKLVIWSEVDTGTEVELRVPATAYVTLKRRSWLSRKNKE